MGAAGAQFPFRLADIYLEGSLRLAIVGEGVSDVTLQWPAPGVTVTTYLHARVTARGSSPTIRRIQFRTARGVGTSHWLAEQRNVLSKPSQPGFKGLISPKVYLYISLSLPKSFSGDRHAPRRPLRSDTMFRIRH